VGVYEEADGTLVAQFGPPFGLPWHGVKEARLMERTLADTVMLAIAACLPAANRGAYATHPPAAERPPL
jgi:hypothetical protein